MNASNRELAYIVRDERRTDGRTDERRRRSCEEITGLDDFAVQLIRPNDGMGGGFFLFAASFSFFFCFFRPPPPLDILVPFLISDSRLPFSKFFALVVSSRSLPNRPTRQMRRLAPAPRSFPSHLVFFFFLFFSVQRRDESLVYSF